LRRSAAGNVGCGDRQRVRVDRTGRRVDDDQFGTVEGVQHMTEGTSAEHADGVVHGRTARDQLEIRDAVDAVQRRLEIAAAQCVAQTGLAFATQP